MSAYFRHQHDASDQPMLRRLWQEDLEAYGLYWRLLELVCRWDQTGTNEASVSWDVLTRETGWRPTKCRRVMGRIVSAADGQFITSEKPDGHVTIQAPGLGKKSKDLVAIEPSEARDICGNQTPAQRGYPPIIQLWNDNCGSLRKAIALTPSRDKSWRRRWSENPDLEYWVHVIRRAAATPFCQGENDRDWVADLDFLLRPDSHVRIIEGKYGEPTGNGRLRLADLWDTTQA